MVRLNGEAKSQVEVSIFLHPMFLQWLNLSQRKSVAEKTIVIFLCVITNPNQTKIRKIEPVGFTSERKTNLQ